MEPKYAVVGNFIEETHTARKGTRVWVMNVSGKQIRVCFHGKRGSWITTWVSRKKITNLRPKLVWPHEHQYNHVGVFETPRLIRRMGLKMPKPTTTDSAGRIW